jgi:ABC-type transport system substrate-binding protein
MGVVGAALPVDPATASVTDPAAAMLDELLWSRLTSTDPTTAAPVPALAESWEAEPDQTRFTFHLRADAAFSDGSPLTSADVAASLTRVAAQGVSSLAGGRLSAVAGYADAATAGVAGITTPDPATVVIELTEPVADLPVILAAPAFGVVPAAVARGERPALPGPTSGPYTVASQAADQLTLSRSPAVPTDLAHIDTFEVRRFDSDDAAAAAFDAGGLDLVPLPADRAASLVTPGPGVVRTSPGAALWWFATDTTDLALTSVDFRRGLAHAADRAAIVSTSLPGRRLLDGLYPPQLPGGTSDACGALCAPDPAATTAAATATFPSGVPEILLDTPDTAAPASASSAFATSLTAAGVPISVRARSFSDYRENVLIPDRQLFWFGWVGVAPTPEAYLPALFLTGAPDNVFGFSDPVVDAAIRTARAAADPTERANRWAEAERLVLERMPLVPLAQAQNAVALSMAVQGFVQRLDGTFAVDQLWLAADTATTAPTASTTSTAAGAG